MIGHPVIGTLVAQQGAGCEYLNEMMTSIVHFPDRYAINENEHICKDGRLVWVSWSNTPLVDERGALIEILCIGNDITGRKHAEAEMKEAVAYLSAINHISQNVMSQKNLLDAVSAASREVIELFHAQHASIALLNEDRTVLNYIGNFHFNMSTGQVSNSQIELENEPASKSVILDGKAIFVSDAMRNPSVISSREFLQKYQINGRAIIPLMIRGNVIGTMNIDFVDPGRVFDRTELDMAETISGAIAGAIKINNLLSAEQRQRQYFEALVQNIPAAVVMIDLQARIQSWNPAAEALFGYSPADAISWNIDDLLSSEETRQEALDYTQASMQGEQSIHSFTHRQRKDGTQVDVELLAVPIFMNGEQLGSIAIYHDISELQRARRDAEAANEAKSSFLATMSHEIRTPLNAIVGMTTLMMDTQLTDEQRDYCETIRSSSDALLTIINDILDFSKIEAGRMELEEQSFDLRECIESSFDLVMTKATEKGIDLAYLLDANVPPFIISDSTRLRQILLNLLSNALKFTQQGEVVLSVSLEKANPSGDEIARIHFAVRDTGIGIPAERTDRLFRSFSQVDASTTRKYGGTGLGLAISKRLSELMGGTMWVESEGIPGKGLPSILLSRPGCQPIRCRCSCTSGNRN